MSAAPAFDLYGGGLTPQDYESLEDRAILASVAEANGLRHVDSYTGRAMFARKSGDMSGILIPNVSPWTSEIREYRLRLENPELEQRIDGTFRERGKYVQPPNRPNILYFPFGTTAASIADVSIPAVIVEGEFKAIALADACRQVGVNMLVIAVTGVYNWRGTVGKRVNSKGARVDVKGPIPDFALVVWKDRRVIIAFDADVHDNPKVRAARWQLQAALLERGGQVGVLEWPAEEGKGIDDRLAKLGAHRVVADLVAVEFGSWRARLLRTEKGKLLSCHENAALHLECNPKWVGVLGYNEFTGGLHVLKNPPSPVTAEVGAEISDSFDTEVVRCLEREGVMVNPDVVRRVVDATARKNAYHPVRDYLETLPAWDGVARIETWLLDYCNVESSDANPNNYAMSVGSKILIAAIARIFEPGCKSDHLLVLESPQGYGKSSLVRILAGDWFTDQLSDPGGKDASMQLRGAWLIELAELSAFGRTDMERLKAFFSQQTERFRLPYGRRVIEVPRQCVFIGTTNSESWLKDETGGRRFWPVRCGAPIDLVGLKRDRDQLWAEALHCYRAGTSWWLEDQRVIAEAAEEQRGRYQEDVWQDRVADHAEQLSDNLRAVSIPEILNRLGIEVAKQDQRAANRVAACLKRAGWERYRQRVGGRGGTLEWRYRKVEPK